VSVEGRGLRFTLDSGVVVSLPLLGLHNVDNALAAIAAGRAMGVEDRVAAEALAAMTGVDMRMQVKRFGAPEAASGVPEGVTLINDAYNANPDSMHSALATLASFPAAAGRRIAVLGDMLELGDESLAEHRRIGDKLFDLHRRPDGDTGIDLVILIGTHMRAAADLLAHTWPRDSYTYFDKWTDDLPARIASMTCAGDTILLKASRGLRFERIAAAVERAFNPAKPQAATVA
jgi:UDP-N-acetylmuramoyl-tripeptide--D-alanyl-D-alanine ligase